MYLHAKYHHFQKSTDAFLNWSYIYCIICRLIKKMVEDGIASLLQNAEFEEILPEERNADGINVDKKILIKIVM